MSEINKRLYRSRSDRMLAGVCGGLGEFLGMDPTVIRVLTVLLTPVWPFTPLAYLILMFVVPEEPLSDQQIEQPDSQAEIESIE